MEIVTEKSEQALVDMLTHVQKKPDDWIAVHINLAPLHKQMIDKEGLSQALLSNIHQMSQQIAQKLLESELSAFSGKILVFEDSDVLALFSKPENSSLQATLSNLRDEFANSAMSDHLTVEDMKERLSRITVLAEEKKQSAEEYQIKRRAAEVGENLSKGVESDLELSKAIQKKRTIRSSSCVLIIEDDILVRGLLATMLGDEHQVVQAKNAESGVIAYIDQAPDIVFLDINMPGLSGRDTLKHLIQIDPNAYVVMLSGQGSADNVLATKAEGAAGFIAKPFSKEKLVDYIKKCPSLDPNATARALGWYAVKKEPSRTT